MDSKFPINSASTNIPSAEKITNEKRELPDYEEKFGHLAEKIIRSALSKRTYAIEKIEKGTKTEDYLGKVDFWLQLKNIPEPIGIQFTTNPEKYKEKKNYLKLKNFIARKEKRPDSEIEWEGNANVVVILGDHAKMIEYWKKIENEGVNPEDVVSDAFIVNFFSQLLVEMGEVNPPKREEIVKSLKDLARDMKKRKKAGK